MIAIGIVTYKDNLSLLSLLNLIGLSPRASEINEIIIVDNGASANLKDELAEFENKYFGVVGNRVKIRLFSSDQNSIGLARKMIVNASTSQFIAFIDPDCRPSLGWVDALFAAVDQFEVDKNLVGITGPIESVSQSATVHQLIQILFSNSFLAKRFSQFATSASSSKRAAMGSSFRPATGSTSNLLLKREFVLAVGNFSERFSRVGEDLELSIRLRRNGYHFAWCEQMKIQHSVPDSISKWLRKIYQYGVGQGMALVVHPTATFKLKFPALISWMLLTVWFIADGFIHLMKAFGWIYLWKITMGIAFLVFGLLILCLCRLASIRHIVNAFFLLVLSVFSLMSFRK